MKTQLFTSYELFVENLNTASVLSIANKGIYRNEKNSESFYIGDELAEVRQDKKDQKYYLFVGDYKRVCEVPSDKLPALVAFMQAVSFTITHTKDMPSLDINGLRDYISKDSYIQKNLPKAAEGFEYAVREARLFKDHPITMKEVTHNDGTKELVYRGVNEKW
jgi:hypothetical protein